MSFEHGQNDAQKVMGVIAISLFSGGLLYDPSGVPISDPAHLYVPAWVVLACGTVIAMGTGIGGWRVIRMLGSKLADLTPVEGFAAETGAGLVLHTPTAFLSPSRGLSLGILLEGGLNYESSAELIPTTTNPGPTPVIDTTLGTVARRGPYFRFAALVRL